MKEGRRPDPGIDVSAISDRREREIAGRYLGMYGQVRRLDAQITEVKKGQGLRPPTRAERRLAERIAVKINRLNAERLRLDAELYQIIQEKGAGLCPTLN